MINKPKSKIALTLFTLRDYCRTAEDLDATLKRVADIGYPSVQVSGFKLDFEVIREKLDKYNLYCCASHDNLDDLQNNTQKVIDKLKTLDCPFTALGAPPGEYISEEGFKKLAAILEESGKKLADAGLTLGYHNHDFEMAHFGGKTFLDTLYELVPEKVLKAELDVHWLARGGKDPAQTLRDYAGRIPVIHLKDLSIVKDEPKFSEVGHGNLNWSAILEAGLDGGVEHFVVEQDKPFPGRDIFDSIAMSYEFLKNKDL